MKTVLAHISLVVLTSFITACDTPWAAAKREKEGITWDEWRGGIRSKEENAKAKTVLEIQRQHQAQWKIDDRNKYFADHPTLQPSVREAIRRGDLIRGMNPDQVRLSWGEPQSINKSTGSYGQHEQWVFGNGKYAYIRNGVLDSWQTRE